MSLHLILARDSRVLVDTGISLPGKGLFFISVHQVNALFVVNFWLAFFYSKLGGSKNHSMKATVFPWRMYFHQL